MSYIAIGIDLGATKIAGALVTEMGEVLMTHHVATNAHDGIESVVQRIANTIEALTAHHHAPLSGVGIGTPGLVNSETGTVVRAVNLHWDNVPLAHLVRAK